MSQKHSAIAGRRPGPERGNLFEDAAGAAAAERFDMLFERPGARIERIVSLGQATQIEAPLVQDADEWVVLLAGAAGLRIDGETERALVPGDYVFIARGVRHWVTWTSADEPTVWLAIHLA